MTDLRPLLNLTGDQGPMVTGLPFMASVKDCCNAENWMISTRRHPVLSLLRACLPTSPPQLDPLEIDFFLWRNSLSDPPGLFSTTKTWISLPPTNQNLTVTWNKSIWFRQRIPKHAFLTWIVARDRLPTRNLLRSWGLNVSSDCLLCGVAEESITHLFFGCNYSSEVWSSFFHHSTLAPPLSLCDIIRWVQTSSRIGRLKSI